MYACSYLQVDLGVTLLFVFFFSVVLCKLFEIIGMINHHRNLCIRKAFLVMIINVANCSFLIVLPDNVSSSRHILFHSSSRPFC